MPATAEPVPLGSPALWNWVTNTTANALKVAESHRDLTAAGLFALNRGFNSSLDGLREVGPRWLRRIDVDMTFRNDLSTSYRLTAAQPLFHAPSDDTMLEARGHLTYDAAGQTRGQLALSYDGRLREQPFEIDVFAGLQDNWASDDRSYTFGGNIGWSALDLRAQLANKVPGPSPSGEQAFEEPIDSYRIELDTELPSLSWARIRARTFWNAAPTSAARDLEGHSLGLWLRPIQPLTLETGTDDTNQKERDWFARLRVRVKLN